MGRWRPLRMEVKFGVEPATRRHPGRLLKPVLYMVVERFNHGNPKPVYRRLEDEGRLMPAGLDYRGSWVTRSMDRCYQLVECEDPDLLEKWAAEWEDLVEFEFVPVVTGEEAEERVRHGLDCRTSPEAEPPDRSPPQ